MEVKFKKLHPDAVLPKHAKYGDAGLDLTITNIEPIFGYNYNGKEVSVREIHHYGVAVEIPEKHVGLMFPRSSIKDYNVSLTNSVGVIDSGYRGELKAVFRVIVNTIGLGEYKAGDRSAQLVIVPYVMAETMFVDELSNSERGESGYGSTNGKKEKSPTVYMHLEEVQKTLAKHFGYFDWDDFVNTQGEKYAEDFLKLFAEDWGIKIVDREE